MPYYYALLIIYAAVFLYIGVRLGVATTLDRQEAKSRRRHPSHAEAVK
jgi:hypothetical protein